MGIRYTTYYSSIEKIVYELTGSVLRDAILEYLLNNGHLKDIEHAKLEIDWSADDDENLTVKLIKTFEKRTFDPEETEHPDD